LHDIGWTAQESAAPEQRADPALESFLAELWCEVLALPAVDALTPFTAVGGDSIQAMRLLNRINDAFGLDLALVELLDAPTVACQATAVQAALLGQMPGAPADRLTSNSDDAQGAADG
jgi:aryl carrier-like protein